MHGETVKITIITIML